MSAPDKTTKKQGYRWAKGQSGNPAGRPPGSRNKATLAAQELLDGDVEALTRKAIKLGLDGDMAALRLCLERIVPARKSAPIMVDLPDFENTSDLPKVMAAIMDATACGNITPDEADALSRIAERHIRALEAVELEKRLSALEKGVKKR